MVIEVVTLSRGISSNRVRISSRVAIDTPTLPTSPAADGVVGIETQLGRQIEGDREAHDALLDKVPVAPVGLRGRPEAGVLPHRPQPLGVHAPIDAARERVAAGLAQPLGPDPREGRRSGSP